MIVIYLCMTWIFNEQLGVCQHVLWCFLNNNNDGKNMHNDHKVSVLSCLNHFYQWCIQYLRYWFCWVFLTLDALAHNKLSYACRTNTHNLRRYYLTVLEIMNFLQQVLVLSRLYMLCMTSVHYVYENHADLKLGLSKGDFRKLSFRQLWTFYHDSWVLLIFKSKTWHVNFEVIYGQDSLCI